MNLSSGRLVENPLARDRLRAVCEQHARLIVVQGETELLAEVAALPSDSSLQLGILGGDGTLMRVMSCLHRIRGSDRLPVIVPIPFGTVCTTSARWGAGRSPWKNLHDWLHRPALILRRHRTLQIVVDGVEYIGCTVGTGLVARFFEQYEARGARGLDTAAWIAVESFLGSFFAGSLARSIMQPISGRLWVDGQPCPLSEFTLVVCSVFENVGLGIRVTHRAGEDPERIALVASSLPASRLGPQFWRVLAGRCLNDPNGVDGLVEGWRLEFAAASPLIIDGDRLTAHSLEVRPGPLWSVLTPAPA